MKSVIVIVLSILLVINTINSEYHTLNGISYFVSVPLQKNWYQAQQYCRFNGMFLISIHTIEEYNIILNVIEQTKINSTSAHFWTSGSDLGHSDKEYFWSATGYPMVYSNWISGYPSNAVHAATNSTYDCLLLHAAHKYKYYNQYCLVTHYFICQDKLQLPNTLRHEICQQN